MKYFRIFTSNDIWLFGDSWLLVAYGKVFTKKILY